MSLVTAVAPGASHTPIGETASGAIGAAAATDGATLLETLGSSFDEGLPGIEVTRRQAQQVRRAMHPVSNAKDSVERSLVTRKPSALTYRHGTCPVKHRTADAAARCRRS